MLLYDGTSDINWFYDGKLTFEEMKNSDAYKTCTEVPVVLYDDDQGTVYSYKKLSDLQLEYNIPLSFSKERSFEILQYKLKGISYDIDKALSLFFSKLAPTDEEAIEFQLFFPTWKSKISYKKDQIVRYRDELYRIGQDHTSQEQWIPGEIGTEALYSKIEFTEEDYEVWQEWDGVSGSYANGQIVQDPTDGRLYKSLIDNNVWGPPSTQPDYWQLYVES